MIVTVFRSRLNPAAEEEYAKWTRHPQRVEAKKKGRANFYTEFKLQTCQLRRESRVPT